MKSSDTNTSEVVSLLGVEYNRIHPDYFISGDVFWTPQSGLIDFTALILVEHFSKDRKLSLTNILGHKAGRKYVAFPNECLDESGHSIPEEWLRKNWDEWVALGRYEDVIFLRATTRLN